MMLIEKGLLFRDTGIINESLIMNFTVGGTFKFEWVAGGWCEGEFIDIVQNKKAIFTWRTWDCPFPTNGWTQVTITLSPDSDGTLLHLSHRDIPTKESHDAHMSGWKTSLEDFASSAEELDSFQDYDWTRQSICMEFPCTAEKLFSYWTSVGGLGKFFIKTGSVADETGRERHETDGFQPGDRYKISLKGGKKVYGRIITVAANRQLKLSFGDVDLDIHFSALNSGSRIELTQYEIPQIKEAHVIYHVRQYALFLDALHRLKALVGMQE